jgi:hypothetical protein
MQAWKFVHLTPNQRDMADTLMWAFTASTRQLTSPTQRRHARRFPDTNTCVCVRVCVCVQHVFWITCVLNKSSQPWFARLDHFSLESNCGKYRTKSLREHSEPAGCMSLCVPRGVFYARPLVRPMSQWDVSTPLHTETGIWPSALCLTDARTRWSSLAAFVYVCSIAWIKVRTSGLNTYTHTHTLQQWHQEPVRRDMQPLPLPPLAQPEGYCAGTVQLVCGYRRKQVRPYCARQLRREVSTCMYIHTHMYIYICTCT